MFEVHCSISGLRYLQQANEVLVTAARRRGKRSRMSATVNPRHMAGASCRRVLQAQCVGVYFQVDTNAKVNGIDILLVGPYDLNNGVGHPVTGHFAPELKDIERVKETAANAGKKPGIYATSEDQARAYGDQAFDSVRSMATRRNLRSFLLMILLRSRWLPTWL